MVTLFQPHLTDQLWSFSASSLPGIWALKGARVEEKEGYHFMWRSGPIGSEWVDLGGTVNKARGSLAVPVKGISHRSGKSLFGNIHDEDEEAS